MNFQRVEAAIMAQVIRQEKHETVGDAILSTITKDLLVKFDECVSAAAPQCEEQILRIRMHQLAIAKILVFTHGLSQFRLVSAHFHLGLSYMRSHCYPQAIQHLILARKKNAKMSQIKETKLYTSLIMTAIGKCYFQSSNYVDSLQMLLRAYDIQQPFALKFDNSETTTLISQCYLRRHNYKALLKFIDESIENLKKKNAEMSPQLILKIMNKSHVFALDNNIQGAVQQIKIAINYYQQHPQYIKQTVAAYETLTQLLLDYNDYQSRMKYLYKIQQYYDQQCEEIIKKSQLNQVKEAYYLNQLNKLNSANQSNQLNQQMIIQLILKMKNGKKLELNEEEKMCFEKLIQTKKNIAESLIKELKYYEAIEKLNFQLMLVAIIGDDLKFRNIKEIIATVLLSLNNTTDIQKYI